MVQIQASEKTLSDNNKFLSGSLQAMFEVRKFPYRDYYFIIGNTCRRITTTNKCFQVLPGVTMYYLSAMCIKVKSTNYI
jgi:hypothetical protein